MLAILLQSEKTLSGGAAAAEKRFARGFDKGRASQPAAGLVEPEGVPEDSGRRNVSNSPAELVDPENL